MFGLIPWKKKTTSHGDLAVRRDDTLSPWLQLREQMDQLFEQFFGRLMMPTTGEDGLQPSWGVDDREQEFVVQADLPGFDPDEIDVSVRGNCLCIQAEHKLEEKDDNNYQHRSRQFYQQVTLPSGIDQENIEAKYHNGVLELHVPKTEEARAKRIEVRA